MTSVDTAPRARGEREGPAAATPEPPPPRTDVMLLNDDLAALRHLAGLWSELYAGPAPEPTVRSEAARPDGAQSGEPETSRAPSGAAGAQPDAEARQSLILVHRAQPQSSLPRTARQVALGSRGWFDGASFASPGKRLIEALGKHEGAMAQFARTAVLVVPDDLVSAARQHAGAQPVTIHPWSQFAAQLRAQQFIRLLGEAAGRSERRPAAASLMEEALELLHTGAVPREMRPGMVREVGRALAVLQGHGGFEEIAGLSASLRSLPDAERAGEGIEAILRSSAVSLGAAGERADADAAAAAFAAAERARTAGQAGDAIRLVTVGLRLIFNGELHTDTAHSPLIDDPAGHLAPWRESAFATYVREALARRPGGLEAAGEQPPRVVVSAGAYGDFAGPIVTLLREAGHDPDVITAGELGPLSTRHNLTEAFVGMWLRIIDPQGWRDLPADPAADRLVAALSARLAGADVVHVDWCDPIAALASVLLGPGTRLVIRVHRVDAMRVWHQFLDLGAVDRLIFVADHVRDVFLGQVTAPGEPAPVASEVLNNVVDVAAYRLAKAPGAHRRIALVGWGRPVKDPEFALDILEELVRHDPEWELHLIGRDFGAAASPVTRAYAERFRRRATSAALRDHIRWVGFTRQLPIALRQCGFALSTSHVEGWPIGVVEAAASGAVPVIRDWPQVAGVGAARAIYAGQPDWVVTTPQEAAARMLALAEQSVWRAESSRAAAQAEQLCRVGNTAQDYLRAILG